VRSVHHAVATFFGLGHAPFASGTWGTAGAVVLVLLLDPLLPGHPSWLFLPVALGLATVLFAVGIPAAAWAEKEYGRKDPSECVIDEVVGYLIAVAWISPPGWSAALIAFFAFRATDVLKIYPCNKLEELPGGWGIMLDDVVAGLYALIVMVPVRLFLTG